jgi:uncharacterized membrane protein
MKRPPLSDIGDRISSHYSSADGVTPVSGAETFRTRVLTATVIVTNVAGNVLLSRGMHDMPNVVGFSPLPYLHALLNPYVAAGVAVLIIWMISDLALLSLADLSFVLPVTATAYAMIALMGHFVLGERVSAARWLGIALITGGVMLVGDTPSRTTPAHRHQDLPEFAEGRR